LKALCFFQEDLAVTMLSDTTYPSYGYMFNNPRETNATTLWELWNAPFEGDGMNSRNHHMFGSVGTYFYRYLAGLKRFYFWYFSYDKFCGHAGIDVQYKSIAIRPPFILSPLLHTVSAYAHGVGVTWERVGNNFLYKISVHSVGKSVSFYLPRVPIALEVNGVTVRMDTLEPLVLDGGEHIIRAEFDAELSPLQMSTQNPFTEYIKKMTRKVEGDCCVCQ
jgi:hypothetical protein